MTDCTQRARLCKEFSSTTVDTVSALELDKHKRYPPPLWPDACSSRDRTTSSPSARPLVHTCQCCYVLHVYSTPSLSACEDPSSPTCGKILANCAIIVRRDSEREREIYVFVVSRALFLPRVLESASAVFLANLHPCMRGSVERCGRTSHLTTMFTLSRSLRFTLSRYDLYRTPSESSTGRARIQCGAGGALGLDR